MDIQGINVPNQVLYTAQYASLIKFVQFKERSSILSIFSSQDKVPFIIKRVFTIEAQEYCNRGAHAHKECFQLLVVLGGQCTITCDDGLKKETFILNTSSEGLLIPATIWAEQVYTSGTILMILTGQFYDPADYIRDYNEFLQWRGVL